MKYFVAASLTAIGVAFLFGNQPANAASLFICDTGGCDNGVNSPDPNITFSMNDFEGGFFINSSLVQQGLSNPQTTVVNESDQNGKPAQIFFSGSWIDLGQVTPMSATIFFLEPGTSEISDVLSYTYATDGQFGHLDGYVMSDVTGAIDFAYLAQLGILPTQYLLEGGHAYDFSNVFISASFQSATPLPATWGMMIGGLSLIGFAASRRKKKGSARIAAA